MISAVLMVRMEPTADDSLAATRALNKFGMAMAAMMRMMPTTISSSINEKPLCLRISIFPRFSLLKSNHLPQFATMFILWEWLQCLGHKGNPVEVTPMKQANGQGIGIGLVFQGA